MDGCPLGLGLVVEDKPTEFSCVCVHACVHMWCVCVRVYMHVCMRMCIFVSQYMYIHILCTYS